jgi:hypothetical protein
MGLKRSLDHELAGHLIQACFWGSIPGFPTVCMELFGMEDFVNTVKYAVLTF